MNQTHEFVIHYKELQDRGLNEKAPNLHVLITKSLKEIIDDRLKGIYKTRFIHWHFEKIRWDFATQKYHIIAAPGVPVQKG